VKSGDVTNMRYMRYTCVGDNPEFANLRDISFLQICDECTYNILESYDSVVLSVPACTYNI
jgi:hypothetical protein